MYDRVNDSIEQDWSNFPHSNSQSILFYNLDILKYYYIIYFTMSSLLRGTTCVQNYEIKGNENIKRKKIIKQIES